MRVQAVLKSREYREISIYAENGRIILNGVGGQEPERYALQIGHNCDHVWDIKLLKWRYEWNSWVSVHNSFMGSRRSI